MVIIDIVPTNEWKFWEIYWINQFRSWGFILENKNNGGGGLTSCTFSEERNKKISKATKGKKRTFTYVFTEEHKNKIKQSRSYLKNRPNTWYNKPVLQYDLNENLIREFQSQQTAQKYMGYNKSDGIGACCRGKQKTAYGYIWKFK